MRGLTPLERLVLAPERPDAPLLLPSPEEWFATAIQLANRGLVSPKFTTFVRVSLLGEPPIKRTALGELALRVCPRGEP